MQYNSKGIVYVTFEWIVVTIQLIVISLRISSRTFLTRSVGSDDFFIVICFILWVVATVSDFNAFLNGMSQHESSLTKDQIVAEAKWTYISLVQVYITYFFVRASVMLFVLRLLPSYKVWQQRAVLATFAINFLATLYTCIAVGISCIPFQANWEDMPEARCFSKGVLVLTNQINSTLACACDIATALIPQFLLWGVQMRPRTKRQLNIIFGLGFITAALSIARACAITEKALTEDTTWNMVPSYYIGAFEPNLGIILSCGPALRQFWAYKTRTKSVLPTRSRQYPNEDFEKMRFRVNLRDVIWYRKAQVVGNRVFDAMPIFRSRSPPPDVSGGSQQSASRVKTSALTVWEQRFKKAALRLPSEATNPSLSNLSERQQRHDESDRGNLSSEKHRSTHRWNLFAPRSKESPSSSRGQTFLLSDTGLTTNTSSTTQDDAFWPLPKGESSGEPSHPRLDSMHKPQGP